jgi:formylglycine-generating enzyme required for sulfatase activity
VRRSPIDGETGVVFVLLPGGSAHLGSDPSDPLGRADEQPAHEVELAPFFLSKLEMTQGQWSRFTGSNPSAFAAGQRHGERVLDLRHPVEHMSWSDARRTLAHLGFALPSEAQWEHAARAGSRTRWCTGDERETLAGAANLADASAGRARAPWQSIADWPENDDGHVVHAPVGSFRPNAFGLHDVAGNVWEWCADEYARYDLPTAPGTGLRLWSGGRERVGRGGSYLDAALSLRSAHRGHSLAEARESSIGVRPARAIE